MDLNPAIEKLLHDQQLVAIFVLVAVDFLFGVAAAVKRGLDPDDPDPGFHFSRLVDFLRDDVLGKVLPWAAIYVFAQMYTGLDLLGISLGDLATAIWVGMLAALVASLATSLGDLGLPIQGIPILGKTLSRQEKKATA